MVRFLAILQSFTPLNSTDSFVRGHGVDANDVEDSISQVIIYIIMFCYYCYQQYNNPQHNFSLQAKELLTYTQHW